MMKTLIGTCVISAIVGAVLLSPPLAFAATTCTWTDVGTVRKLNNDCTTDETLTIPDGFTFDGNGFQITALDPADGHFVGAVLTNGGATAHVIDALITAELTKDICDAGALRLRGIDVLPKN